MCDSVLEQIDQQVRSASLAAMPEEIRLVDDILLHMNHGMSLLPGISNDTSVNLLAVLLLHRAFGSLWRAREDAACGYPVQSFALCRAALEDWGTLWYVERHPETRNLWLRDVLEEVEAPGQVPSFRDIWDDLGGLGTMAKEAYSVLSLFSHPRGRGLPWLYHLDAEKGYFHTGGYFDRRGLERCLFCLVTVAQLFLERIRQLQCRVLGEASLEWVQRANEISKEGAEFIDRVSGEILKELETDGSSSPETHEHQEAD